MRTANERIDMLLRYATLTWEAAESELRHGDSKRYDSMRSLAIEAEDEAEAIRRASAKAAASKHL